MDSPWLRVRQVDDEGCCLRLSFVWDERQIVADQATLWGAEAAGVAPHPTAATSRTLSAWLSAYEAAAFRVSADEGRRRQTALEGRLPFDILWLFRSSVQSTRGPFEGFVADAAANLQDRAEPAYRDLALALVAASGTASRRELRGIRDAASFFDIRSLKVTTIR